ncbi:hypothetical protein B0A48_06155 [Cryoendolithus antarcticus]|uniref:Uncharacterized protein n=1 Tax=Cryoendolithus antarcticus TaxID=1507870 RepID=A0A1V8TA73_9PEZI|nr:hypothetical protein B0A48_06155 [Cryoendolithus antarcticus]
MATTMPTTTATTLPVTHTTEQSNPRMTLLITTFPGLGLPRTLSIPVSSSTSIHDVLTTIYARLPNPDIVRSLLVTTTTNKLLHLQDEAAISTLQASGPADFLPLRISARLCGGKGGFGSQLRAAGGRMSSRKNRDRQNQSGSNRNLDGRRLRTIDEAKQLADYLATKPEMEKAEREERKKRWEAVVDAVEATEERIKSGKMGSNQGRLDAEYVESKQVAEEKVREAVMKAMREQNAADARTGSESSLEEEDGSGGEEEDASESDDDAEMPEASSSRTFFGWDDEDDEDDEDEADDEARPTDAEIHLPKDAVSVQLVEELKSTVPPSLSEAAQIEAT